MKKLKPHAVDWAQIDRFLASADKTRPLRRNESGPEDWAGNRGLAGQVRVCGRSMFGSDRRTQANLNVEQLILRYLWLPSPG
jgi:hypothetical protein